MSFECKNKLIIKSITYKKLDSRVKAVCVTLIN